MKNLDNFTDNQTKDLVSATISPMTNCDLVVSNDPLVQTLISPSGSSMDEEVDQDMDSDEISMSPASFVDPEPHLSNQFYTFNHDSHHLMVHCILQSRYATPEEIKTATPASVLNSWRGVWKDRNEDTAYSTGWKRIQDKLKADIDGFGNEVLYFKNNPHQFVPHINQWKEIAFSYHSHSVFRHLGLRETIDKIKQVWTVGAKFYGIPESFVRACIANCNVCRSDGSAVQPRLKRRRFEYTDTFEVPAKEVPQKLQQLAAKHKVVLCIRQKYIRYKPFMAEVKDYCCHRAGEPNMKKPGLLQRKRYSSKRCGCGFRIRAIVPIKDYNQKDKSFSYEEDGKAVFKLYAVHSGHEPGPHEGSARIIHRFVGPANLAIEQGAVYFGEEGKEGEEAFAMIERDREDFADTRFTVFKQLEELKSELGFVVEKIPKFSEEVLGSLSFELSEISQRLRRIGEMSECDKMIVEKEQHSREAFLDDPNNLSVVVWEDDPDSKNSGGAGTLIDGHGFFDTMEDVSQRKISPRRQTRKAVSKADQLGRVKLGKWDLQVEEASAQFDDKVSLLCESTKDCKDPVLDVRHDMVIPEDENLVGMTVDGYYHDSIKWYLDPSSECGDNLSIAVQEGFRHAIV